MRYLYLLVALTLLLPSLVSANKMEKRMTAIDDYVISDGKLKKIWTRNDHYKDKKKWVSWVGANEYIALKNRVRLGGFNDWRMPTRMELKSLYSRRLSGELTYDKSEVLRVSGKFNVAYCYFWTKEKVAGDFYWQVSLCNGRAYKVGKENAPGNSVLLIRP